ncbi:histone-lysine N-methyltransferase SETMAR [Trichonephila clavipes]|nr:histone-lysine N-methyltransferase SETMAR [Trichonephila clavipes]
MCHFVRWGAVVLEPYIPEVTNGPNTVITNYGRFWLRRFRSDIPVVGNVDKITEMIESNQHVSRCGIACELKIHHKTFLNHLHKAGFKKRLDVWVPH